MVRKRKARVFQAAVLLAFCVMLFAACGRDREASRAETGTEVVRKDILVTDAAFYDVAEQDDSLKFLAMQYYQGEPVQLWASGYYVKNAEKYVDIYLYQKDGTRELCLEGINRELGIHIRFADAEGCFYSINGNSLTKLNASGRVEYTVSSDDFIREICQVPDGRLFLLVLPGGSGAEYKLAELDGEGNIASVSMTVPISGSSHIGASEDGLVLMDGDYIYQVDLKEGKLSEIFSFRQSSYAAEQIITSSSRTIRAFYMGGKDTLEVLRADSSGSGTCESLSIAEQDADKVSIVLRSLSIQNDSWLKEQIARFNRASDKYYVVIETTEEGDDREAFITATGVQLATGKGADILQGNNLIDSVGSLIDKGGLEDLGPLMKQSGIKEEDYFSAAFKLWGREEKVYSICYKLMIEEPLLKTDVLGDVENPDIETVVDAMLAYPEKGIYRNYWSAESIVRELLEASETLGGMVDWEKGTCDFSGGLLAKILEAAKRYQYDARNNYPEIADSRDVNFVGFYSFETLEEAKARGYTVSGKLFDDGCHPCVNSSYFVLAVNANSENKEGAWEFLSFLLSEEAQLTLYDSSKDLPVKRSAFQAAAEAEITDWHPTTVNIAFDGALTQERVDRMVSFIEDARAAPVATEGILEIICEEAQDYFGGVKEISQVAEVIENRVKLYLQETAR